jgi:peptide/nickel transport system substrate-binding protein
VQSQFFITQKPENMTRSALLSIVAASLLTSVAFAAVRPRYGGTLRLATSAAPTSLDPANSATDTPTIRNIYRLIFDTLVVLDSQGKPQPALATSWQAEPGDQRWHFQLRPGLTFQDGTAITVDAVAASLRAANSTWRIVPTGSGIDIECQTPEPTLPAQLALPNYGIAKRSTGKLAASGAFAISRWDPGKKLTLTAREDYWRGRAFVDFIEIEMGKNFRDQMIALDLNQADVVEIPAEQARRATAEGRHVANSGVELLALAFAREARSTDESKLRDALAMGIDRGAINNGLLQGQGEPAGTLLPNWMTGYAFLFPADLNLAGARRMRAETLAVSSWSLGYDSADALSRVIAERIVLNARDAGLTLQLTTSATPDLRLQRVPLQSLEPRVVLTMLAAKTGMSVPKFADDSPSSLYAAEAALLQSRRIIPLLHIRNSLGLGAKVKNWSADRDGTWHLEDIWLGAEKP